MNIANDRADLLAELEEIARATDSIEGMVLVGSGARGFTDDLSDLDVVFVVDPTESLEAVVGSMVKRFATDHPHTLALSQFRHHEEVFVLCFLFDNLLELDLGIWSLNRLFASKPDWIVRYAKSDRVEKKLSATPLAQLKPNETAEDLRRSLWINARAAMVAIQRKQILKAAATVNSIRSSAIRLVGEMHGVSSDHERAVEKLDDPLAALLRSSLTETPESQGLQKSLEVVCSACVAAMEEAGVDVSAEKSYLPRLFEIA